MILDKGINFIRGENNVGKTTFLWELSQILNLLNYNLCFVGGSRDFENNYNFLKIFDYAFFNVGDERMFSLILQISERIDYLIIDDVDYIDTKFIDLIFSRFNKPIILTCNLNRVYYDFKYKHINFILHKNKSIELEGNMIIKTDQFLNSIKRENKIEKLLNDKS
jgi:hypothetical protein